MSKIQGEDLELAIKNIYARKALKDYNYAGVETIDLQIKLRNYTAKDKRFSGSVKLQYATRKKVKVCVLGNKKDYDTAKSLNFEALSLEEMTKTYKVKNKKLRNKKVKKLASKYTGFIASQSLITKIPRVLGPGLSKAGKFPAVIEKGDTIPEKMEEIAKTVKFQFKKEVCIGTAIGHLELAPEDLKTNVNTCINFLVSLLKKNWQNVGSITLKSNQGRPQLIYPPGNVEEQTQEQLVARINMEKRKALRAKYAAEVKKSQAEGEVVQEKVKGKPKKEEEKVEEKKVEEEKKEE